MKRILTTLLMVCCIAASSMDQNGSSQYVDFQIVAQGQVDTPIYRTPAIIPVQGYYSSSINTLYLFFTYDLGIITVSIEDTSTGDFISESMSTNNGMQSITTNLQAGHYIVAP